MHAAVSLLGHFDVTVDGHAVPRDAWVRRHAAHLVKVLALAHRRTLHREQVMDALWPEVDVTDAAPRLHKAAHYARRAIGHPHAVVLAGETVSLLPDVDVRVDATEFARAAADAVARSDAAAAADAADLYGGDLLPDDPYEPWAQEAREHLRRLHLDVLRLAGRWSRLLQVEPTDEDAHLRLARAALAAGDDDRALRQLERMEQALRLELGTGPSAAALALRAAVLRRASPHEPPVPQPPPAAPIGRERECARLERLLTDVAGGRGQALFVSGRAGMGTSTMLLHLERCALARDMLVGTGVAAQVEAAWPYAPVMEALSDLCRRHPALLTSLEVAAREEIQRALSGQELDWDGGSAHQRLYVACTQLLRLAAQHGAVLLVVDDGDEADEASLSLLHYLVRATAGDRVLVALGHAFEVRPGLARMRSALLARDQATTLQLDPLSPEASAAVVRRRVTDDDVVRALCDLAGGVPLRLEEMARAAAAGERDPLRGAVLPDTLPTALVDVLAVAALLGGTFSTDEFAALAGIEPSEASRAIRAAVDRGVLTRTRAGVTFRHAVVRDSLLRRLDVMGRADGHLRAAAALRATGASAARVAHHLLEGGDAKAAVPFVLRAAQTQAALGAYRDALAGLDRVRGDAEGDDLALLLALRAELLTECGDLGAADAYREALAQTHDHEAAERLRVRLARTAVLTGDLDTARFALEGIEPRGEDEAADAELLMARGHLHLFSGDLDSARADAELAKRLVGISSRSPRAAFDLVAFDGLLAHFRGEWFHRLRGELRRGAAQPGVAAGIFDSHLCVAEYLLYGPDPYEEVMELAGALRESARQAGTLRAVAFATALRGEAALLMGDLPRATADLEEAVELHHTIGSSAGEAHSLQRLAEVRLAAGHVPAARDLVARSLPLARWSTMPGCLLPRVYGTQIASAPDAAAGAAAAEQAQAALGQEDHCYFCTIMLDVPATIAFADLGDLEAARRHLERAEVAAARWQSLGWDAAVTEARAHVVDAEGDVDAAATLLEQAAVMFTQAGRPLDAERCREHRQRPAGLSR